jgi:DnaJ-related protein SCJ1
MGILSINKGYILYILAIFLVFWVLLEVCESREKDYYELFGLTRGSFSQRALKKAYYELAKECHPDKNKTPEAHEKFVKISHAYEVLMDDDKRKIYDTYGEEGLKQHANGGGGGGYEFHDPFDIFAQFAGFGFKRRASGETKTHSPSIHVDLPVSLKEIFFGAKIEVDIDKQVECSICHGSGAKTPDDVVKCTACGGSGVKVIQQIVMGAFIQQSRSTCTTCNGKGKVIRTSCPLCKGKRIGRNHREGAVRVPRGARDGDKITLENAGDEHPDKIPGHIIFHIVLEQDSMFQRLGDNLYTTLTITLQEALLGFTKQLTYLDGSSILVQRVNITQPGFVQTIKGYGLPKTEIYASQEEKPWWDRAETDEDDSEDGKRPIPPPASKRGDLFITFQVVIVDNFSLAEKETMGKALKNMSPPEPLVVDRATLPEHLDL